MWSIYRVIFRVRSPLHIGRGKVGNLQRTRSYVTGRVFWGALTMRLTRDAANGRSPAIDSQEYQSVGKEVHDSLVYTYFYPATKSETGYQIAWPWADESRFSHRFLSSYSGTSLAYPQQAAATGMLHEVEFISPNTLDTGKPVFLMGYVFAKVGNKLPWQAACSRLQLGGERGYGWGDVKLIETSEAQNNALFDGTVAFDGRDDLPRVRLAASAEMPARLLAHTCPTKLSARGEVEPLVGREWRSCNSRHRYAGQHVEVSGVYFAPGSIVDQPLDFTIGEFGIWRNAALSPDSMSSAT